MKRRFFWIAIIVLILLVVLSLEDKKENVVSLPSDNQKQTDQDKTIASDISEKASLILSIDVNTAADNDFDKALRKAREAGSQSISLSINWDDYETSPNQFAPAVNFLSVANGYYPKANLPVSLTIRSVDTNGKHHPSDLKNKSVDDPEVVERFQKFLDYCFLQIPDLQLVSLGIGNEIDLGITDSVMWGDYENFYRQVSEYVRSKKPGIKIGVPATLYGLTKNQKSRLQEINRHSDVIMATYYPINPDFSVKDINVIESEMGELMESYPTQVIHFREIGYPSSSILKSSETKQADFISEVFRIWDKQPRIQYMSFLWLTDRSQGEVNNFASYYGSSDRNFKEYLGSLGLRTNDNKDKLSYIRLKDEAKRRGW